MTRAEAIEILKDDVMCQRGWINQLSGMTKEIAEGRIKAHELAISSLETDEAYQLEYEKPTTKNDLGVDAISRAEAQTEIEMNASRYTIAKERGGMGQVEWSDQLIKVSDAVDIIRHLPSVTPQLSSELEKNSKLEKIRDQLKSKLRGVEITLEVLVENDPLRPKMEVAKTTLEDCLELIDKAEAESI